jgi:predicted glycosyltransferase involved in capsule biosynthesis
MKLGIVVPYRNREDHLPLFIEHMQHYIKDVDFKIYVVEQTQEKPFNRGKLLNVGSVLAFKEGCDYVALHDVDMLPVVADYSYVETPTHMAVEVQQFGWHLPYANYFGGVTLFDKASFEKINGFHNEYWGWGGEDDDLFYRCERENVPISRRNGRYISLPHTHTGSAHPNHKNNETLSNQMRMGEVDYKQFGLSNLEYTVKEDTNEAQIRHVIVEI